MKIRIVTEGRTIAVEMTKEQAQQTFNNFAAVLLNMGIGKEDERQHILPRKKAEEIKETGIDLIDPEEGYSGFLYIKCQECGKVRGFCAKEKLTEYQCECSAITPLVDLHRMYVNCQCGRQFKYKTNMDMGMFDVNCIECGNPVAVSWNDKKMIYQTIQ